MLFDDKYLKLNKIGQGAQGSVYAVYQNNENKAFSENLYALKKIRFSNIKTDEIDILKEIDHPYIIKLNSNFYQNEIPHIVLEYCCLNLYDLQKQHSQFYTLNYNDILSIIKQIILAVYYIHEHNIMHLDLSMSNILFDKQGNIKLADFGLAKKYNLGQTYSKKVVARAYRPPEILFGSNNYDMSVDMWSLGCIIAELYIGQPLFDGKSNTEQLSKIINIMGSPEDNDWQQAKNLPYYEEFHNKGKKNLNDVIQNAPQKIIAILKQLLQLNPGNRMKIQQLIQEDIFDIEFDSQYSIYIKQLYNQNIQQLCQLKDYIINKR